MVSFSGAGRSGFAIVNVDANSGSVEGRSSVPAGAIAQASSAPENEGSNDC